MNLNAKTSKPNLSSRRRGPDCVSDLILDRCLGGDLDGEARTRLERHLAACATCTNAFAALSEDRAGFLASVDVPTLAADAVARATVIPSVEEMGIAALVAALARRVALPLGLAAAAVGGFLMLARTPAHQDAVRAKGAGYAHGAFSLSTFVKHEEQKGVGTPHTGEPLHPGDQLQFRYNGEAGFLAIIAVDDQAKVSVYYPPGPTAAPVGPGLDVPLASAVKLDGTLGRETIVAVRCAEAVPVEDIRRAAGRAVDAARTGGAPPQAFGPLGLPCAESRVDIQKIAPPP